MIFWGCDLLLFHFFKFTYFVYLRCALLCRRVPGYSDRAAFLVQYVDVGVNENSPQIACISFPEKQRDLLT